VEGADNLISVGRIARPHGIRGEVKVTPLTDWPEKYEEFRSVYLELEDKNGEWVDIEKARIQGSRVILKLSGIDDRTHAETIRGYNLKVREETCSALPDGSYRISHLIGLGVNTTSGEQLGTIVDVMRMPSQDVYIIDAGGKEILIPAVKKFIKQVDVQNKVMIIEPIEGLLE